MNRKWWVLTSVACGTFMATLDSSVVNIALPILTKELSVDLHHVKWVVIIYLLVITCTVLPFGRLSDLRGRKPVFQWGYFIFTLGSACCSLAPTLNGLVIFRALQAIGASMLMANGPAIITATFSSMDRGAALGTLAMVVSAGLVTGPSFGGFIISHLGWRSIFWINIPIGIIGILLVKRFVRKDAPVRRPQPFDWTGAVVQTVLLLLMIVAFDPPHYRTTTGQGVSLPRGLILLGVAFIGFLFFKIESRAKAPLFDLSLLKIQTFWTANVAGFCTFVAFSSISVMMPFFLEEALHLPIHQAGLFMTAIPLTIFAVAPVSGRLSDRFGSQFLSFCGALLGAFGLFFMAGLFGGGMSETSSTFRIVFNLCIIGFAMGVFQSPNNSAIMGSVPIQKLGVASALLATVRNLGLVVGTGLSTTLFSWRMHATGGDFLSSFHLTLFVAGFVALGAMLASSIKRRRRCKEGIG